MILERKLSEIRFVTIHHSATVEASQDLATLTNRAKIYDTLHGKKEYRLATRKEFGLEWNSYHFMYSAKGHELQVQDIKYQRNHAGDRASGSKSHNIYGIALCVDMNTTTHKISTSVKRAMAKRIYLLEKKLGKSLEVRTHKEVSLTATACAGNLMGTHLEGGCKEIIKMVNEMHSNNGQLVQPPATLPTCAEQLVDTLEQLKISQKKVIDLEANIKLLKESAKEDSILVEKQQEEIRQLQTDLASAIQKWKECEQGVSSMSGLESFIEWVKGIWKR